MDKARIPHMGDARSGRGIYDCTQSFGELFVAPIVVPQLKESRKCN